MEKPSLKMQTVSARQSVVSKGRSVTPTIRSRQPSAVMPKGVAANTKDGKTFSRSLTRKATQGQEAEEGGKEKSMGETSTTSVNLKKRVSTATLNEYKSLFTMFDIENKGYILIDDLLCSYPADLLKEVRAMGLDSNPYLSRAIIQIGRNKGRITLDDFLEFMCMDVGFHSTTAEIDLMFFLLDLNEDKLLDASELRVCAKQAGELESNIDFPDLIECLNLPSGSLGVPPDIFRQLVLGQYIAPEDED